MEIFGAPPTALVQRGKWKTTFFHSDLTPKLKADKKGKIRLPGEKSLQQMLGQDTD